ncbi:signal peptidase II [Tropicimonas sp.]|uniref:signal peptidase II n=1 Tax=Tropicimonas sp. TaxID=2067044 RepID=UPI003A8A2BF1
MRLLWFSAIFAFAVDQISKYLVFSWFARVSRDLIEIFPPLLVFRRGMNRGVNFGLFANSSDLHRWVLIILSAGLCFLLWLWARRSFQTPVEFVGAGLVIGGALGNVADRLWLHGVRDFLNMSCCGFQNPYVFNVADVFIFTGALMLVLFGGKKQAGKMPS